MLLDQDFDNCLLFARQVPPGLMVLCLMTWCLGPFLKLGYLGSCRLAGVDEEAWVVCCWLGYWLVLLMIKVAAWLVQWPHPRSY